MADDSERRSKRQKLEHDSSDEVEFVVGPKSEESDVGSKSATPGTTNGGTDGKEAPHSNTAGITPPNPLSKNQQKKMRRHAEWEAKKPERQAKRKEARHKQQDRRREEKAKLGDAAPPTNNEIKRSLQRASKQVPITFLVDCNFNDLMLVNELKSLASQVTRIYSDSKIAACRPHLALSSFGGTLEERFKIVLQGQYKGWQGVHFQTEDFVEVGKMANEWMRGSDGGALIGALAGQEGVAKLRQTREAKKVEAEKEGATVDGSTESTVTQTAQPSESSMDVDSAPPAMTASLPVPSASESNGPSTDTDTIIYLTSESETTLTTLLPHHTYIIGGLVDHNRHKGICHRRALDRNIKTARLPIGDYLDMASRKVLATNHVAEIMLKWMECGDWGQAFLSVIPKRKGGSLRTDLPGQEGVDDDDDGDDDGTGEVLNGLEGIKEGMEAQEGAVRQDDP